MSLLILTRKIEQAVIIRTPLGDVTVRIGGVERDRVKLLFEAPLEVVILREELTTRPM